MDFLGIHFSGILILELAMPLMLAFLTSAALLVMIIEKRNRLSREIRQDLQHPPSCTRPGRPAEHQTVHQEL